MKIEIKDLNKPSWGSQSYKTRQEAVDVLNKRVKSLGIKDKKCVAVSDKSSDAKLASQATIAKQDNINVPNTGLNNSNPTISLVILAISIIVISGLIIKFSKKINRRIVNFVLAVFMVVSSSFSLTKPTNAAEDCHDGNPYDIAYVSIEALEEYVNPNDWNDRSTKISYIPKVDYIIRDLTNEVLDKEFFLNIEVDIATETEKERFNNPDPLNKKQISEYFDYFNIPENERTFEKYISLPQYNDGEKDYFWKDYILEQKKNRDIFLNNRMTSGHLIEITAESSPIGPNICNNNVFYLEYKTFMQYDS